MNTARTISSTEAGAAARVPRVIHDPTETRHRAQHQRTNDRVLIQFARLTLATLENNPEWSADTPEEIADHAFNLAIATTDGNGQFIAAPGR